MSFNKRLPLETPSAGPAGFSANIYTGNGSTAVTVSTGFQPDLIWIKARDHAHSHFLSDTSRGGSPNFGFISTNNTSATAIDNTAGVQSVASGGFNVRDYNVAQSNAQGFSGQNGSYVAFSWKVNGGTTATKTDGNIDSTVQVNTDLGTSIVQFTNSSASGSTRIGHGLGGTPNMILLKRTDGVEDWYMYHDGMLDGNGSPLKQFMRPNKTNGQAEATNLFNTVNSTVFNPSFTGTANQAIIAYCFKNVAGYSHFGSYTGNGQANQAVDVGFSPDWILMKSTVGNDNWRMFDTVRGINNGFLEVDNSVVEDTTGQPQMAITSTGFSFTSGGVTQGLNANNNLVTYWAFKINE